MSVTFKTSLLTLPSLVHNFPAEKNQKLERHQAPGPGLFQQHPHLQQQHQQQKPKHHGHGQGLYHLKMIIVF